MIEITDSPDIKQWSEFVYNHEHGNIFQTPEMAEVYKRTKNYNPITLAAIDDATDEILGTLQAVVTKGNSVPHPKEVEQWFRCMIRWHAKT